MCEDKELISFEQWYLFMVGMELGFIFDLIVKFRGGGPMTFIDWGTVVMGVIGAVVLAITSRPRN